MRSDRCGRGARHALRDLTVLYRQTPKDTGSGHFGSRLAFRADRTLFVTLGERQLGAPAQDLGTSLGKVVRIARDGSIPVDRLNAAGARPATAPAGRAAHFTGSPQFDA